MDRDTASGGRPLLALTLGDPAGIGREITVPAAREATARGVARVVVIGPADCAPDDFERIDAPAELRGALGWIATEAPDAGYTLGQVQASCGRAAVAALRRGHDLAMAREVDALVTGPVNKAALHAAGTRVEGQTELLSTWAGVERTEMIGLAGALRVMLATRHMPLAEALRRLTTELVLDRLVLFDEALRTLRFETPRIAVAGLNPHAGEGGLLGSEDAEILEPAVQLARDRGIDAVGPVSPDAVFAQGARGAYTGVLALYHDQAFIPLKLVGDGLGVTYIAGLPYPRFSPMHGTAFDIVGRTGPSGAPLADPANLLEALISASALLRPASG